MADTEKDARQIAEIWQHHKTVNDGLEMAALHLDEWADSEAEGKDPGSVPAWIARIIREHATAIRALKEPTP